jgi:hypothetical protein
MQGSSTLRQADPHNLIVAMLDGVDAADFAGTESMQEMPGFAATLSDDELAHLANYLRSTLGRPAGQRNGSERQGVALRRVVLKEAALPSIQTVAPFAAICRCSSGQIFATASSPARIAALRWPKSLPLMAARFGRMTKSAYLSSS